MQQAVGSGGTPETGGEQVLLGTVPLRGVTSPGGAVALALGLGNAGQIASEVARLEAGKPEGTFVQIEAAG